MTPAMVRAAADTVATAMRRRPRETAPFARPDGSVSTAGSGIAGSAHSSNRSSADSAPSLCPMASSTTGMTSPLSRSSSVSYGGDGRRRGASSADAKAPRGLRFCSAGGMGASPAISTPHSRASAAQSVSSGHALGWSAIRSSQGHQPGSLAKAHNCRGVRRGSRAGVPAAFLLRIRFPFRRRVVFVAADAGHSQPGGLPRAVDARELHGPGPVAAGVDGAGGGIRVL